MKTPDLIMPARFSLDVPNFGDYFGIWCIEENEFRNLVNRFQGINLHAHINSEVAGERIAAQNKTDYAVTKEGIALFAINGVMMKSVGSMSNGTSTVRVRQQLRSAERDSDVKGAMLIMDTPGGTVRGNQDLADAVAKFAAAKPIYAFTEDMTASAGVSIASQATKRFANNAAALYGGMGTYAVLEDMTGMAEQLGVKVHVIKAGEFKGMGEPGTQVTEAHLQEAQRIVNSFNENYLGLIARGLGKSVESIRPLADGRVHPASDAVSMGLIHGVQSVDETYSQLVAATKKSRPVSVSQRTKPMNDENAATLAELKAAFPNSNAEWRESQIESNASLQQAAIAYAKDADAKLVAERAEHKKQLDEAQAKAKAVNTSIGHDPIVAHGGDGEEYIESGDAIDDFNAAVAKLAGDRPNLRTGRGPSSASQTRVPNCTRRTYSPPTTANCNTD